MKNSYIKPSIEIVELDNILPIANSLNMYGNDHGTLNSNEILSKERLIIEEEEFEFTSEKDPWDSGLW